MVSCREQWAVTAPCLKLPRFSFILNRGFKLLARGPLTAQVTPTCGPYLHIKSAILSEEQIWGCQQLCRDAVITRLSSETLFCCRSLVFLFAVGLRSSYSVFLCVFPVSCVSVAPPEHMHNRCSDCCHSPRHHIRGVAARLCRNSSETRLGLFHLLCESAAPFSLSYCDLRSSFAPCNHHLH